MEPRRYSRRPHWDMGPRPKPREASELSEADTVDFLELLDWRRRVSDLFGELRRRPPNAETLAWFRGEKDALYGTHPQSPLPAERRKEFRGLPYWDHEPKARVEAHFKPLEELEMDLAVSAGETIALLQIGQVEFELSGEQLHLDVFWVNEYSGGLFIPFRDGTSGSETYGGGRYLVDTAKSADLGSDAKRGTITLDFNYAYHPSCAFDSKWACPLAPTQNAIHIPIRAGEKLAAAAS